MAKDVLLRSRGMPWTLVFGIVGFSGLVLAIYFWANPRHPKASLAYRVSQDRPLLSGGPLTTEHLELRLGENVIEEPWVWAAQLVNDGKAPLRADDFAEPLVFVFPDRSRFLQVQSLAGPMSLSQRDLTGDELHFGWAPTVMNPGDVFEIAALTDGQQPHSELRGKVAGVREIKHIDADGKYIGVTSGVARKAAAYDLLMALGPALLVAVSVGLAAYFVSRWLIGSP